MRCSQTEDSASDSSSHSEASVFQRQHRRLQKSRTDRCSYRCSPLRKQRSKQAKQSEGSTKSRCRQLCSPHKRKLLSRPGTRRFERDAIEQSSSKVAYQAAISPLISSDACSGDMSGDQVNLDSSALARVLARIAKQNINTSNGQHRQLPRQQQVPSSRRRTGYQQSPMQSESPVQIPMPRSPSPLPPSPAEQRQRQFQSRRGNRENRRSDYTDWEYEQNSSNWNEIYRSPDDFRRRTSSRQSLQQPRQPAVQPSRRQSQQIQEPRKQQQKRSRELRQKEQLQQLPRQSKLQMDKIYSGNHAPSDLMLPGRTRRCQRPDRSRMRYQMDDYDQDEPDDTCREEDEDLNFFQPSSSAQHRMENPERQAADRRWKKYETLSDRQTAASRPRHLCRDGNKLQPTQNRRETLFHCPYVTLSLHTQTFECAECIAAARDQRGGRHDRSRYRRDLPDESDESPAGWSKNCR
ncbi:hypothetical protein BOX15_Mlig022219g2 [Macrostomum lignano]|uniref:Uncharacterized protein n=1 Tax=Macrostomum lignano TaxID=282301 RepID=A0A267DFX1_9PLAT|nr:hypothetical protein BOX15_Mlig022219g3 [Macrostomum lignano]PAA48151.1 hypothetical protein BOX15_Mlig022219g2 [Macrostomum lignano]